MALHERNSVPTEAEVLSRREYQEILLARMAAGDLYANELRLRMRRVDMMLDKLRVALGGKAIYGEVTQNIPCADLTNLQNTPKIPLDQKLENP